ncbi:DUF418 domain-containing protein [Marinactinospora rubrisoli]|uniref:DUF418 domain-containing protein n=1 Tax=Marinactinospora rubrisoli TaxID=2715399 RepID=A0ABW2KM45_9ACTN
MDTTAATPAPRADAAAAPHQRSALLDILRGVAIVGTLGTNIWIFTAAGGEASLLVGASISPAASMLADPGPGTIAEGVFRFLANGKFLALLTLLFGVGLAIQFRSAARRGGRWPGPYRWRALFLLAEGTVHFVLVFAWDVLMGYAVTALVVAWLLTRSQRAQHAVMWTAAALNVALMALLTLGLTLSPAGSISRGGDDAAEAARLYAEGGYLDLVGLRLSNAVAFRIEPVLSSALLLFLFLLGVRLFRAGAFGDDATGRRIRGRLLGWGLGAGLPLNLATTLGGENFFLLDRYVAAPVLALGYIGLVGFVADRVRRGPVTTAFSALGRTALSGYVLQNVICVLVCYGFGLGLAARFAGTGPWWVFGLWAAVSLLLLVAAPLWLRRFPAGPLEALQKWTLTRLPEGARR